VATRKSFASLSNLSPRKSLGSLMSKLSPEPSTAEMSLPSSPRSTAIQTTSVIRTQSLGIQGWAFIGTCDGHRMGDSDENSAPRVASSDGGGAAAMDTSHPRVQSTGSDVQVFSRPRFVELFLRQG
jgi:hypothetical protein